MEQRNGYFRITWKEQLAVCHLFAPKAEGVPVSYKELASFFGRSWDQRLQGARTGGGNRYGKRLRGAGR